MFPYLSTVQDVSICLRCQSRLATRRLLRRGPNNRTKGVLSRFITSGHNAAQHNIGLDDSVVDNPAKAPERMKPKKRYLSDRSPFRQLNLHIKDALDIDALGQPAEVLLLRNELRQALKKQEFMTLGEANVTLGNSASSAPSATSDELLASIDSERGIVGTDRIKTNLESVKGTWVSGLRDRFGPPTAFEIEELGRKLCDSFTTDQLLNYFHKAGTSGPWEIDKDYSSELYKRSAWTPGTTPFPGDSSSRLRSLKLVKNSTLPGEDPTNRTKGRPLKLIVANKIIRQLWHIQSEQEKEALGELDVWLQPEHLDLVLNHRRDVLKRLSEVYGAKVEASRSYGVLRITADHDTASDVLKLLQYILKNIRRAELDLPTDGRKDTKYKMALSVLLNKPLLEQIEQLTSTIIKTSIASPAGGGEEKLIVYYLGPSDGDFEDVRRLTLQALEPAATNKTQAQWIGPIKAEGVIRYPVDVGTGLPLSERSTEWSRWSSGIRKRSKEIAEAGNPLSTRRPALAQSRDDTKLSQVIASTNSFLFGKAQGERTIARHDPVLLGSYWDRELRYNTSAVFGQLLYPKSPETGMDITEQIKSRREFLTTVPGLRQFLTELRLPSLNQQEEMFIKLIPTPRSASEKTFVNNLPDLDIRVAIDTESRTTSLHSVRLIVRERQSDILLPNEMMDLRFVAESYLSARKQVDPRIRDFVAASNLNIWGEDRLKTPASLTISIPPHALQSQTGRSNTLPDPGLEIPVNYIFAGLSHRSFLQDEFLKFFMEYSTIEAGRTGGRRDELRLSLPGVIRAHDSKGLFSSFFRAAHDLVQEFKQPEAVLHERRGDSVVTRRIGRIRHGVTNRRRLVRRTRTLGPTAQR